MARTMRKSEMVLERDVTRGGRARYLPTEDAALDVVVHLGADLSVDLGHPETITLTIEPGDRLNPRTDT